MHATAAGHRHTRPAFGRLAARFVAVAMLVPAALLGPAGPAAATPPGGATVAAAIDLDLDMSAPDRVVPGRPTVYRLQISFSQRPTAARTTVTLPAGLTFDTSRSGTILCGPHESGQPCQRNSGPCRPNATRTVATCTVTRTDTDWYEFFLTATVARTVQIGTDLDATATTASEGTDPTPENNTATVRSTTVAGYDLGVTATQPTAAIVPGGTISYTVVVHNYGPTAVTYTAVFESTDRWYYSARIPKEVASCFADPGSLICEITTRIEPGAEVRIPHVLQTRDDPDLWGKRFTIGVHVRDDPPGFPGASNDDAVIRFRFADKPAAPTPGGGSNGGTAPGGGSGGGLPVTGPGALPLAATGVLLVLAGAATILLGRRRRSNEVDRTTGPA